MSIPEYQLKIIRAPIYSNPPASHKKPAVTGETVEQYLARGGVITHIPPGVSGLSETATKTQASFSEIL